MQKLEAGIKTIARKKTSNCCWIGCDGYQSFSFNRKWSNWSPYLLSTAFPEKDTAVDELCTIIRKADPDVNLEGLNIYSNYRESFFDPGYLFFSVCGNCANVCWQNKKDRIKNRELIAGSGIVVLRTNGQRTSVNHEKDIVEIDTSFNLKVALLKEEYNAAVNGKIQIEYDKADTLSDKTVLKTLNLEK